MPPTAKRRTKKGERKPGQQRRTKQPSAAAQEDKHDLKGLFAMLEGFVGSDEQMLEMLEEAVARRRAGEDTLQTRQPLKLPTVPGALLPVHRLQVELLQTLAAEERQASYLRGVGKQVQDEQLLEKLSLNRPQQRTGFDGVGTVASVRSPRAEPTLRRNRRPKPVTADEVFAHALSERRQQRPTTTVTTWSARDTDKPRVREWLRNKEMQSTSQQTLDLINWILILTRQGKMTEDRLRAEMANYGPIPPGYLRQIRTAMSNVAYSERLQKKRGNRQPSPPREATGLLGISITGHNGEHHIEAEPRGLLPEELMTPQPEPQNEAKDRLGNAMLQAVNEMLSGDSTFKSSVKDSTARSDASGGTSWVSRRRTGGLGLSPSEAAAKVASSARAQA